RMAVVKKVSILGDYKLYAASSLAVADNAMESLATALKDRMDAHKKRSTVAVGLGKLVDFCKKMFGLPDSGQSRFLEKLEREHRRR
ncbi:hypothetical protein KAR91_45560, partial [Candidatus Pacearchaeota archaeon]|nr:hypothetical protein [Candidatus Pacearchaeota archaeon]